MSPEKRTTSQSERVESMQEKEFIKIGKAALSIEKAPEDFLSISGMSRQLGVDKNTIKKRVEALGFEGTIYKDKTGSNNTTFFSPTEQQQIIELLEKSVPAKTPPENYLNINELAAEMNIDPATLKKRAKHLLDDYGEPFKSKNGKKALYFSPDNQEKIYSSLANYLLADVAPEGYLTVNAIAKNNNVTFKVIDKQVKLLGITGTHYRDDNGRDFVFYSPEDQQKISNSLESYLEARPAPDGYCSLSELSNKCKVDKETIRRRIDILGINGEQFNKHNNVVDCYSPEEQCMILESLGRTFSSSSIPENSVAFYFQQAANIKQGLRPNWLKNPRTGHNLEIDVFVDPPGVGIEYDGYYYHQDAEYDAEKDSIAQKNGYSIIHIREDGCPEMPEGSYCIKRKNNNDDTDLGECIRKCFEMLDIPVPDIDVIRDKKEIMTFMRQRTLGELNSAKTFDELSVVS